MIDQLKALFSGKENLQSSDIKAEDKIHMAAAALLIEAANMDGDFDENERKIIKSLLQTRFNLTSEETDILVADAEHVVDKSGQLYGFTKVVKEHFDENDRVRIIEMLWEVSFADGKVDAFERNLIQRVAGLIFVSDKARGLARRRVMAKLGIQE